MLPLQQKQSFSHYLSLRSMWYFRRSLGDRWCRLLFHPNLNHPPSHPRRKPSRHHLQPKNCMRFLHWHHRLDQPLEDEWYHHRLRALFQDGGHHTTHWHCRDHLRDHSPNHPIRCSQRVIYLLPQQNQDWRCLCPLIQPCLRWTFYLGSIHCKISHYHCRHSRTNHP